MKQIAWLLLCAACVCMRQASAQEALNYASISGRVSDASGAVVEGATVTAQHIDTHIARSTATDKDGRFRVPFLAVGQYRVRVHQAGFTDVVRTVTLTVGAAFDFPVALSVDPLKTEVVVTCGCGMLEAVRSEIAGTISQKEVSGLPLNGRNFLDLALLVPGVSPTNTASNQLFAETSAVPGQGISIGSQRNFSNNFIVDGLSANDDAAGLSGIFYGLDVVREFQVVTSGGQAELGRALGGYVNMVTKSGTNALQGDIYGYFRNQRFNAANPLSNTKLPSTQAQYGASLGGPIVADRSFFFANFEQRSLNQSGLITIAPANVAAIDARLAAVGYRGAPVTGGLYPNPVHNTNFLGKVDHQVSAADQFSVRYSLYHADSDNSRGAGGLSAISASAALLDTDQTVAASNVWSLSSRTLNETRAQYTRSNLLAQPTDPIGPAVTISGVAAFGTLSGSPTGRVNDLFEITDSVSHQMGSHALRAGIDFLYNDVTITYPRSLHGAYTFSSLANFLAGTYSNAGYTQTFGNPAIAQTNPNVGFYLQDEWKITSRLTLNLGVRYDLQFLQTISTDSNNLSPRAGFAWTPFAARRTVIRGGYGLFYDRVPLRALANALLSQNGQTSLGFSPTQTGAPVFPNVLASPLPGVLPNLTSINLNLQNAYSEQGSVEIERQIGQNATLTVGYEHLRGLHLLMSINQNVPTCVAAGSNNGCRPNPNFANNSQYQSLADSHYDGLHVSFVQRPVRWGNYRISYSYSKALDNVGEFFFSSPLDPTNIWRDYGRSDDDQRHRVVFDGTAHARGFELSGALQYYSALPFNVLTGATTIQGTAARPAGLGRNTGIGPDNFTVSARLSRTFAIREPWQVQTMIEAFNLLNHRNNLTVNGTYGTGAAPLPTFGQVTAVNDSRVLQLAMRLKF